MILKTPNRLGSRNPNCLSKRAPPPPIWSTHPTILIECLILCRVLCRNCRMQHICAMPKWFASLPTKLWIRIPSCQAYTGESGDPPMHLCCSAGRSLYFSEKFVSCSGFPGLSRTAYCDRPFSESDFTALKVWSRKYRIWIIAMGAAGIKPGVDVTLVSQNIRQIPHKDTSFPHFRPPNLYCNHYAKYRMRYCQHGFPAEV